MPTYKHLLASEHLAMLQYPAMGYSADDIREFTRVLNKLNGAKGAAVRNKRLNGKRRSEIARKAALARWKKARETA